MKLLILITHHTINRNQGEQMKGRNICLYVNSRNEDTLEVLDEYADMWGMCRNGALFRMVKDYSKMKMKERIAELEGAKR